MAIELQNVSKSFGEKQVLQDFSHTFPEGELTCVMGPSGCGKTTLLSLLLGMEQPDAGEILGMEGRRKSAVFQEDRLCENASAVSNIRLVNPALSKGEAEAMLRELGLGLCWKAGVAAEVIGLPDGSIGERLYEAKVYLNTPDLFAWTVVIVLVSLVFEKLFLFLLDRLVARLERG